MHDDNGYVIRGRDGFYVRRQWYAKTWQLVVGLLHARFELLKVPHVWIVGQPAEETN